MDTLVSIQLLCRFFHFTYLKCLGDKSSQKGHLYPPVPGPPGQDSIIRAASLALMAGRSLGIGLIASLVPYLRLASLFGREERHWRVRYPLGGGNSNIFYFHPEPWGR